MNSNSLVSQQLNNSLVNQLQDAAYAPWVKDTTRKSVTDLFIVNNGHLIINPNSNQDLGTGEINIFEHGAKQAIYACFDLCLDAFVIAGVGYYELVNNRDVAYERTASMFMNVDGKGWTAFHLMDHKFLPMDLPEEGSAIETMRLKYAWLDMIVKGAYIDINIADYAPQMYNYFASLLVMEPAQCRATIAAHIANKREKRLAWAASVTEATPAPATFTVSGEELSLDAVRTIKNVVVTKDSYTFTTSTASDNAINQLAWLLVHGYTLSRPS